MCFQVSESLNPPHQSRPAPLPVLNKMSRGIREKFLAKDLLSSALGWGSRHLALSIPGHKLGKDVLCPHWVRGHAGHVVQHTGNINGVPLDITNINGVPHGAWHECGLAACSLGVKLKGLVCHREGTCVQAEYSFHIYCIGLEMS